MTKNQRPEVITIANHKGGCGKTTTTVNLSYSLSQKDKKVLVIDLDPQGHASLGFNIDPDRLQKSIFDLLDPESNGKTAVNDCIVHLYPNIDLIPSNMTLSYIEQILAGKKQREYRLKNIVEDLKEYNYILIDTGPSLGLLTVNALIAANKVIIPVEPSSYALHGLQKLEETLNMLSKNLGHTPQVRYLLTLHDINSQYSSDFEATFRSYFGSEIFSTKISCSDIYKDAATLGLPVLEHSPRNKISKEYLKTAKEVIDWSSNIQSAYIGKLPENQEEQIVPFTSKLIRSKNADKFSTILKETEVDYNYKFAYDLNGEMFTYKVTEPDISLTKIN